MVIGWWRFGELQSPPEYPEVPDHAPECIGEECAYYLDDDGEMEPTYCGCACHRPDYWED